MTAENKEQGFIKVYRSMLQWEWWDDLNTWRLFMTILIMANWKDKKWHGKTIPRGSLWTSLKSLSKQSGLSVRQVRVSLDKLIMTNEVTNQVTKRGRLITVVNYDFYQSVEDNVTNTMTNNTSIKRQSRDKVVTTTKERKEVKELKNNVVVVAKTKKEFWQRLSPDDIDSIYDVYPETGGLLIDEVAEEVVSKKRNVRNPVPYILEYAKRVKWNDGADHFKEV